MIAQRLTHHAILRIKAKSILQARKQGVNKFTETRRLVARKYVDNLTFCSDEFRRDFQSIEFRVAFKYEHGGKGIHLPVPFLKGYK